MLRSVLLVLVVSFPVLALGQEPASAPPASAPAAPPEPDYEGVYALLDPATGKLSDLERAEAVTRERRGSGLVTKVRIFEFPAGRSPVRIPPGVQPEIVVRVPSQSKDPMSIVYFYSVEMRGNQRALPYAKVDSLSGRIEKLPLVRVPIQVSKYGSASFRFTPTELKRPGEYCLSSSLNPFFFCFGAD